MEMTCRTDTRRAQGAPRPLLVLVLALLAAALALPVAARAAQAPPSASTSGVSNVSYSSAILYGYIDAKGAGTNYLFQYGTTIAYGAQSPLSPGGNATSSVRVSQAITGLRPTTLYHYRVVAFGPTGTAVGKDRTFTTGKIPLSLALIFSPNPVVFGSPFFVDGTFSGTGGANHAIVLQINPFPYVSGFKTVGNPELTNSVGGFSFPYVGLLENAKLRVVTVGLPVVVSPEVLEEVAVRASFHVRSTRRRGYVRLYGTVTPAEPGAQVGFQLLKPGHASINQGGTTVKAGSATVSSFSAVVRMRRPGLYRALIKVSADGAHVSSYSPPILVR
jgi:hypothetical protein